MRGPLVAVVHTLLRAIGATRLYVLRFITKLWIRHPARDNVPIANIILIASISWRVPRARFV